MKNGKLKKAVILAAGNGLRMSGNGHLPKPLTRLCGRPMLDHVLDRLRESSIEQVTVVTGYRASAIEDHTASQNGGIPVECVHNPRFYEANGVSLLACEDQVEEPFLLLMSDHMFQGGTLDRLMQQDIPPESGIIATDSKVVSVFDLADATKVASAGGRVQAIGKRLKNYDSIDTGMFLLQPAIFDCLRESVSEGDGSLSGGIGVMARRGKMETWDVGEGRWIDVDTRAALCEAERMMDAGQLD